ncbi:MAG: TauD/TfdA family dioxygenase [Ectothiorhodospiraceae bacterium]|nr:TauD/TfdA family dioxygenase [Ectothiorhodospiraceae bacterium]
MNAVRMTPITERSVWTGSELAADPAWRHTLTPGEVAELDAAVRAVRARGLGVAAFTREDFELPTLGPRIAALADEVENGRGVAMLRGVPVERYDRETVEILYWGFGVHAGEPISQNSRGQLISEVSDRGNDYGDINARGFATNAELMPHVDTSDATSLLCLRAARSGGESRVISSTAVYNVILDEHPEHLAILCRGFHNDLRGEGPTGDVDELTTNRVPVYSDFAGRVSCSFNYRMIEGAATKSGVPLTGEERAALDFLRAVAEREEMGYGFRLAPGDIQMVSNHSAFHSRASFVDHDEPARRRCLLRFWLNIREGRPLADDFACRYNTGPRGGVAVGEGARYVF